MVVSKEDEESLRYNADKWSDALAERDAMKRKIDRMMKVFAEKERAVQEWRTKIQSSIAGTKRCTKCSAMVAVAVYDDHLATHERDNTEETHLSMLDNFQKEVEKVSRRRGYLNSQGGKNKSPGDKRPSRDAEAEVEPPTKGQRKEGFSRTTSTGGDQGRSDADEDLEASFHSTRSGSSAGTQSTSHYPTNPGNQQQQQNQHQQQQSTRIVEAQSLSAGLAQLIPKMAGTNGAKDKKRATDVKKATVPTGKKRTGKVADGTAGSQTDDEGTDGEAEHGDLSGWGNGAGGPRAESGPPTLNGSDPQPRGL
jgi:hypothetical protein